MNTTPYAQYTKLRDGSWGLRAPGKLTAGNSVVVRKRDGQTKAETVERVLWTGKDKDGTLVSLCAIAPSGHHAGGYSSGNHDGECRCRHCGQWTPDGDDWCMACGRADYE